MLQQSYFLFLFIRISITVKLLLSLQVAAWTQDIEPPLLASIVVEPATIDITNSNQAVAFIWQLTDNLSGLPGPFNSSPTQIRLRSPSGNQFVTSVLSPSELISGTLLDGTFRDTVNFPRYSESGVWQPEYVLLVDNVGNSKNFNKSELAVLGINPSVVVSGLSDLIPPTLTAITRDQITIDITESSRAVTFTWKVFDDLSGLPGPSGSSPTQMRLRSPSGNQFVTSVLSQNDLGSHDK
ncbi:MAG: hypothetical protein SFX18_09030 [Pirellulales bacterium]|nr:hypothetical protein [Pirellulales bacterium]